MSVTPVSLLERLQRNPDELSWQRLVTLYRPLIHAWLRRHQVTRDDADDLAQDVFTVLVRELPHFHHDGRTGAFRKWLKVVVINRMRGHWRARQHRPQGTGDSDFLNMLGQLEDPSSGLSRLWEQEHHRHVAHRLLEEIRREFSDSAWLAFQRTVVEGVPAKAVASELETTVNAVLLAKSRVLRRLREEGRGLLD